MQANNILIVEDERSTREMLITLLGKIGYPARGASNGREALELLRTERFSLIITDIRMPEMSGMEMLEAMRRDDPDTPVVMLTGFGSVENAVDAMREGASDYLLKPVTLEALGRICKRFITHRRTFSPDHEKTVTANKDEKSPPPGIITQDPEMISALELIKKVAASDVTVLIRGETGTGKELFAERLHQESGRRDQPYLAMNCAALPEQLAESELFGHEKGAFTGAISRKIGRFEKASEGTLVLDEISEMPLALQAKLLRVLQQKEIDRVGGNASISIDTRIVALSNVDLAEAVKEGKFREDLYYRINVVPITIPPLNRRRGDIALLAQHFMRKYSEKNSKAYEEISPRAMNALMGMPWPGNVRELENMMARAVLIGNGHRIEPSDFMMDQAVEQAPPEAGAGIAETDGVAVGRTVKDMERTLITQTLEHLNYNRTHAAKMLGISIRTLRNKLKEYEQESLDAGGDGSPTL